VSRPARARHRLTRAAAAPLLLAVLMFALLWLTGDSWFLLLAGAAIGVFGLGATSRAQINELIMSAQHEQRVAVGEELAASFLVSNPGRHTTSPVSLHVHTTGLADVTVYVGSLWPGESASIPTRRQALHRGTAEFMQVEMTSSPSLGLVRARVHRVFAAPVTIHPQRLEAGNAPKTRRQANNSEGNAVRGPGTEPHGVREWRHGDDHRHVHWRSTARHGRLVVLERGETQVSALRLVLVGPTPAEGFETALAQAAATCDVARRSGQHVTVAAWLPGGPAVALVGSRLELLDWWSALDDVVLPDARHFARTAIAVFGRGDLVVAGPATVLDSWFPGARDACSPSRLLRLETPS
jgi:uncharacterized protein (DUF58 family)